MNETSTIDMGVMPEKGDTDQPCMPCTKEHDKGPRYPEWCLHDKHAELFLKAYPTIKKGDTFDLEGLLLRVCGWSDTQYDKSITFQVITFPSGAIPEESEDENPEHEAEEAPDYEKKEHEAGREMSVPEEKKEVKPSKGNKGGLGEMIGASDSE